MARAAVNPAAQATESPLETGLVNAHAEDVPAANAPIPGDTLATAEAKPPWELLRPLTVGSTVAAGWKIAGLTGAVHGTCVVTLENANGRQHRIHICRNDGNPIGIVYTERFDLIAMNGGKGDLPTEESFARAIAELAHVLAANEGSATVVSSLMPHTERLSMSDSRLR